MVMADENDLWEKRRLMNTGGFIFDLASGVHMPNDFQ
jgi:hypothetical protein